MSMKTPTRQEDEVLLQWIASRLEGQNSTEIGKLFPMVGDRVTKGDRVRASTNRVKVDDIGHEPEAVEGYW